jgi:4-hydroxybutyrate dehydrogenase
MGMSHQSLLPDEAILIPEFLEALPFKVYMHSSIDALIHAVESYLSPKANQITDALSIEAIQTIIEIYNTLDTVGKDQRKASFNQMLTASTLAGLSFNNAGVGAVHALSYPLGAQYHVPHGESNFQFFTEVMKTYHQKNPTGKIKNLITLIEQVFGYETDHFEQLNQLICRLIEKPNLRDYGMVKEDIELFSKRVIDTQQRLLKNNYERLTYEEIKSIYKKLY